MSWDWLQLQNAYAGIEPPARHVLYTATGFGADCWSTYPADLARAISPDIWPAGLDEHWWWQPVSYGPNGIPAAFPMQPSIDDGGREMARLMRQHSPDQTWGFAAYSEGSIVTSNILDRCGITKSSVPHDLSDYAHSFVGGVTFGAPRREAHHTLPGGIDPSGHGIVRPNLVGTPESVWDFAAGANQPGSPGQDLYTTSGYRGDPWTEDDESAVWEIVRTANLSGTEPLIIQIIKLLQDPAHGVPSAGVAIFDALDFFVVGGLRPHSAYQFIKPIPGDDRDCWRIALDYLNWIGANVAARGPGSPTVDRR